MKKPLPVVELIEDLRANPPPPFFSMALAKEAYAIIYPDTNSYEKENGILFNHEECALLFCAQDTFDLLMEALGHPETASLIVYLLDVPAGVMDSVERSFLSVDEA